MVMVLIQGRNPSKLSNFRVYQIRAINILQINVDNKWKRSNHQKFIQNLPWAAVDTVDNIRKDIYNLVRKLAVQRNAKLDDSDYHARFQSYQARTEKWEAWAGFMEMWLSTLAAH